VWYSKNDPASFTLAEAIRTTVRAALLPENNRACKAATSSIYLLHHLHVPAVLVECGFLSNPEEAALLSDENYQRELAKTLADAIVGYLQSASCATLSSDYFLQTA
jgi:N-acetylmuramoyl-L-alanine amidase